MKSSRAKHFNECDVEDSNVDNERGQISKRLTRGAIEQSEIDTLTAIG